MTAFSYKHMIISYLLCTHTTLFAFPLTDSHLPSPTIPHSLTYLTYAYHTCSPISSPSTPHTHTLTCMLGEPFPWRRLGYPNMISMLQAMPEAVHFDYSQKDSDYLLRGVGDKNSFFMPSWQQKTQGDPSEQ